MNATGSFFPGQNKFFPDIRADPCRIHPPRDLSSILGAVTKLPLAYWQPHMLFFGAPDSELSDVTTGGFPHVVVHRKTHPVFSLRALPDQAGDLACPCTSRVRHSAGVAHIKNGCVLDYTGYVMQRATYVLDHLPFPVPKSIARRLRFKGCVPETCLHVDTRERNFYECRGCREP